MKLKRPEGYFDYTKVEKLTSRKGNTPNIKFQVSEATEQTKTTRNKKLFCLKRNGVEQEKEVKATE